MIIDKKIINLKLTKEEVAIIRRAEIILSTINEQIQENEDPEIHIDGASWNPECFVTAEDVLRSLRVNGEEKFFIS